MGTEVGRQEGEKERTGEGGGRRKWVRGSKQGLGAEGYGGHGWPVGAGRSRGAKRGWACIGLELNYSNT